MSGAFRSSGPLPDDGRGRDGCERAGQGAGVYGSRPARERQQLTKEHNCGDRAGLICCTALRRFWHDSVVSNDLI